MTENTLSRKRRRRLRTHALRRSALAAGIYLAVCLLYIVFSTGIASSIAASEEQLKRFETWKGIGFVVVTGALLFCLLYWHWRKVERHDQHMREQEQQLMAAELRAGAAMMSSAIAHDLNNLLMSVNGVVEELRRREDLGETVAHARRSLERGADRMRRMASRMAATAGDALPTEKQRVDLRGLLDDVVYLVRKHPDATMCRFDLDLDGAVEASVNTYLFEDAVANLLLNASQAQSSADHSHVMLRCRKEDEEALLEVHDAGPGVPVTKSEEIFTPCFTTRKRGSGMGLLTVKAFAVAHGGSVTVDRSQLGGALFLLRFPLSGSEAASAETRSTSSEASQEAPARQKRSRAAKGAARD